MLMDKDNWTNYLKSYSVTMTDNKSDGSQLMGSMGLAT